MGRRTDSTGPERAPILLVAGARPNFVKVAPLYRALERRCGRRVSIIHTGQHYDEAMSGAFFRDLDVPPPAVNLEVGPGSHAEQTAKIMTRFEPIALEQAPTWVVVFGDVNSTVACALVAAKLGIHVAHVEAGLRSRDWTMPEEINRVVTDRLSSRLYAPSRDACDNLAREGIPADRVALVGNIMVDTLFEQLPTIDQAATLSSVGVEAQRYVLVTLHRPSNVDDPERFGRICEVLRETSKSEVVLFPAHPRTALSIDRFGLRAMLQDTRLLPPLGYRDFLALMKGARVVVTDSGGIQEETTALGVPCLTLRPNTERPITVSEGTNQLVEPDLDNFMRALHAANGKRHRIPELWDGRTAERIADDLLLA